MTAIIQAYTQFELYSLLDNFKKRHTYINVHDSYKQGTMHFLEVEYFD